MSEYSDVYSDAYSNEYNDRYSGRCSDEYSDKYSTNSMQISVNCTLVWIASTPKRCVCVCV
jgi:hypothetical protein